MVKKVNSTNWTQDYEATVAEYEALSNVKSQNIDSIEAQIPTGQTGLVAYYKFNQGFALSNNTSVNTLTDSSGNSNTGTLNGFALTGSTSNWVAPGGVVTGSSGPAPVSAASPQVFCSSATVASLSATGSNIKWYSVATGGTALVATTVLGTATYYVTQTIGSCESPRKAVLVKAITIPISGTTVITNVSCNSGTNGVINLTPSGGTAPYTFNWGGGVTTEDRTGLAAGNYSVIITDANGCLGGVNATVTQPSAPVSGTRVVTNVACNGGSNGAINLTPSGGTAPYTFNWGSGITTEDRTGLLAGTYAVTITDNNGCTGTVVV